MLVSQEIKSLNLRYLDNYLALNNPFSGGTAVFDLRELDFISPSAAVSLVAACHSLNRDGRNPEIVIDQSPACSFLQRLGFYKALKGIANITTFPADFALNDYESLYGSNPRTLEITAITKNTNLRDVLDEKVVRALRRQMGYEEFEAYDVAKAVSEIAHNVVDHNKKGMGFLTMQIYQDSDFLAIGLADFGEGILNTMKKNPKFMHLTTDKEAILEARKLGSSRLDDRTRGTGLHHLLEITYKYEGSVHIRSGKSRIKFRFDKKQAYAFPCPYMPGTQFSLIFHSVSRSLT